jgi:hypothetical protein
MLTTDTLKPFINHKDRRIRRNIMSYVDKGNIRDPEILPLALESFEKYNDLFLIYKCSNQYIDDNSANRLFRIAQQTREYSVEMHTYLLLENSNLHWLENNIEQLQADFVFSWKKAAVRLRLKDYSPYQLWDELQRYAGFCDNDNEEFQPFYEDALIEKLSYYNYPDEKTVCSLLEDPNVIDRYLEFFLVKLAGKRKLKQAAATIVEKLQSEETALSERCIKSLSEIASEEIIETLKTQFLENPWHYQLDAAIILGNIKSKHSEQAIIELLEKRNSYEEDIYAHLCVALCDQFSEKAFEWCKEVINEPEVCQIDSMREQLIVLAQVLNIYLPEAEKWERQLEQDYERQFRKQSKAGKLGQQFREYIEKINTEEFAQTVADIKNNQNNTDENNHTPPEIPIVNTSGKIGRNQSCPCGSGKKYKKCCGLPEGDFRNN